MSGGKIEPFLRPEMDVKIYVKDLYERRIRIPKLKKLYEKKIARLQSFQRGKDIWKNNRY